MTESCRDWLEMRSEVCKGGVRGEASTGGSLRSEEGKTPTLPLNRAGLTEWSILLTGEIQRKLR